MGFYEDYESYINEYDEACSEGDNDWACDVAFNLAEELGNDCSSKDDSWDNHAYDWYSRSFEHAEDNQRAYDAARGCAQSLEAHDSAKGFPAHRCLGGDARDWYIIAFYYAEGTDLAWVAQKLASMIDEYEKVPDYKGELNDIGRNIIGEMSRLDVIGRVLDQVENTYDLDRVDAMLDVFCKSAKDSGKAYESFFYSYMANHYNEFKGAFSYEEASFLVAEFYNRSDAWPVRLREIGELLEENVESLCTNPARYRQAEQIIDACNKEKCREEEERMKREQPEKWEALQEEKRRAAAEKYEREKAAEAEKLRQQEILESQRQMSYTEAELWAKRQRQKKVLIVLAIIVALILSSVLGAPRL